MINYTWFFFALLAPILFSIVQILTKYVISKHFDDVWHYGCYFYIKAVTIEEITRVIPLFRFMPLFVIIISYFYLSEKLPSLFLLAFVLIFIGSILISPIF